IISNIIESSGIENQLQATQISKILAGIAKSVMIDKPGGSRIELSSSQLNLFQSREYTLGLIGKTVQSVDADISFQSGVFDSLDPIKQASLDTVDVQIFSWKTNPFSFNA